MRRFEIAWKDNINEFERKTKVVVSKSTENLGEDCLKAISIFQHIFGKSTEILSLQELDENKNSIGEIIKPIGDSTIVPIKKGK